MSVKVAKVSPLQHFLYVLIGSIPMIITTMIMSYILYADYARNNYSFFRKDLYISNIDKTDYEKRDLECGSGSSVASCSSSPQVCFRYFSDFLITDQDSKTLLKVAQNGFSHGESDASSSILDISSKTVTKGKSVVPIAREKYFTNEAELVAFRKVKNMVLEVLAKRYDIKNVYPTKPVYFQKLVKRDSKEDNYSDIVVDKVINPSCQYTAVFQLSTYILEFNGARFNFLDNTTMTSIQPKLGRLIIYSSGSENTHQTEKMDYGESYSLHIPFTCDKSLALADDQF